MSGREQNISAQCFTAALPHILVPALGGVAAVQESDKRQGDNEELDVTAICLQSDKKVAAPAAPGDGNV